MNQMKDYQRMIPEEGDIEVDFSLILLHLGFLTSLNPSQRDPQRSLLGQFVVQLSNDEHKQAFKANLFTILTAIQSINIRDHYKYFDNFQVLSNDILESVTLFVDQQSNFQQNSMMRSKIDPEQTQMDTVCPITLQCEALLQLVLQPECFSLNNSHMVKLHLTFMSLFLNMKDSISRDHRYSLERHEIEKFKFKPDITSSQNNQQPMKNRIPISEPNKYYNQIKRDIRERTFENFTVKREKEASVMEKCTFHPSVCPKSTKIVYHQVPEIHVGQKQFSSYLSQEDKLENNEKDKYGEYQLLEDGQNGDSGSDIGAASKIFKNLSPTEERITNRMQKLMKDFVQERRTGKKDGVSTEQREFEKSAKELKLKPDITKSQLSFFTALRKSPRLNNDMSKGKIVKTSQRKPDQKKQNQTGAKTQRTQTSQYSQKFQQKLKQKNSPKTFRQTNTIRQPVEKKEEKKQNYSSGKKKQPNQTTVSNQLLSSSEKIEQLKNASSIFQIQSINYDEQLKNADEDQRDRIKYLLTASLEAARGRQINDLLSQKYHQQSPRAPPSAQDYSSPIRDNHLNKQQSPSISCLQSSQLETSSMVINYETQKSEPPLEVYNANADLKSFQSSSKIKLASIAEEKSFSLNGGGPLSNTQRNEDDAKRDKTGEEIYVQNTLLSFDRQKSLPWNQRQKNPEMTYSPASQQKFPLSNRVSQLVEPTRISQNTKDASFDLMTYMKLTANSSSSSVCLSQQKQIAATDNTSLHASQLQECGSTTPLAAKIESSHKKQLPCAEPTETNHKDDKPISNYTEHIDQQIQLKSKQVHSNQFSSSIHALNPVDLLTEQNSNLETEKVIDTEGKVILFDDALMNNEVHPNQLYKEEQKSLKIEGQCLQSPKQGTGRQFNADCDGDEKQSTSSRRPYLYVNETRSITASSISKSPSVQQFFDYADEFQFEGGKAVTPFQIDSNQLTGHRRCARSSDTEFQADDFYWRPTNQSISQSSGVQIIVSVPGELISQNDSKNHAADLDFGEDLRSQGDFEVRISDIEHQAALLSSKASSMAAQQLQVDDGQMQDAQQIQVHHNIEGEKSLRTLEEEKFQILQMEGIMNAGIEDQRSKEQRKFNDIAEEVPPHKYILKRHLNSL